MNFGKETLKLGFRWFPLVPGGGDLSLCCRKMQRLNVILACAVAKRSVWMLNSEWGCAEPSVDALKMFVRRILNAAVPFITCDFYIGSSKPTT